MKVVIVNQPMDMLVKPHQNSIGIWTYQTASRLAARHDVTVVGKRSPAQRQVSEQPEVHYRFVPPIVPNRKVMGLLDKRRNDRLPSYASAISYLDYGIRAAHIARQARADIVHIHNFTQFVPTVRALCPDAKIVLHMHCEWLNQLDPEVIDRRLEKTDLVIGSSDYITERAAAAFPHRGDRFATVYNGVDIDQFVADSDSGQGAPPDDDRDRRLLFVGRVSPEKGVHDLVRAFVLVASEDSTVSLDLVGPLTSLPREFIVDVDDDPAIQQLAEFYEPGSNYEAHLRSLVPPNLAERVRFHGAIAQADLVGLYQRADVVVNPSYSESFGMSLVEALACRTAVVATRTGGMPGIVGEDETVGILVDRADVQGLAQAVLSLLGDDFRREAAGRRGRELVKERFTWDRITSSLLTEYERVVT